MNDIIPIFSTSSSLSQGGIFTLEEKPRDKGPISLIKFVKEEKLEQLFLVESNFESFIALNKHIGKICKPIFGLKLVICNDIADKSAESCNIESKIIIVLKEDKAYKSLIKIFSKAAQDGFYYVPRIDWKHLKEMWDDGLMLCLPYYSSFLFKNTFRFNSIVPDFPVAPILFKECGQKLMFDDYYNPVLDNYAKSNNLQIQDVKSIYYKTREDGRKFLLWRTVLNQSTWAKPQMEFMSSKEFCWESYKQLC